MATSPQDSVAYSLLQGPSQSGPTQDKADDRVPPATEVSTRSVGAQVSPRPYLLTNHNIMTPRRTARNTVLTILTSTITCFRERITGTREPR